MKTPTIIIDLEKCYALETATQKAGAAKAYAINAVEIAIAAASGIYAPAIDIAMDAKAAQLTSEAAWKKLPSNRRDAASKILTTGRQIATAAAKLGEYYSGETSHSVRVGPEAKAETITGRGEQYSRSCTYKKTTAAHIVTITLAGLPSLVAGCEICYLSERDGLRLISLMPDGSAVWVVAKNKSIISQSGWIFADQKQCYHSTKSADDAKRGLARKIAAAEKVRMESIQSKKAARRAALIARLCTHAVATVDDAKALGYCLPGIAAFQSAHSIGNTASLPELVKTGNAAAVALALSIARKIASKAA